MSGFSAPRTFRLYRRNHAAVVRNHKTDAASVSGDAVTLEGVLFSDGRVAVRWLTPNRSTVAWDSIDDFMAVHVSNHPDYGTEIVWDEPGTTALIEVAS